MLRPFVSPENAATENEAPRSIPPDVVRDGPSAPHPWWPTRPSHGLHHQIPLPRRVRPRARAP
jgi:hypothetical protein